MAYGANFRHSPRDSYWVQGTALRAGFCHSPRDSYWVQGNALPSLRRAG